ncbi:uncharacterized protein PAC_17226 [Phialocephala subalpina]|uniref:DUF6594 domain-containing protein n=1 Tax=Phialocephala subalpina TaxID=576137 RepID=A0A1L7XQX0_9HELO|nr:uncharacterized protein PAC_17226 [Phialocephala subalpina]
MGYNKLSRFMVSRDMAMFRQFQECAARDLLYLQAELVHLEAEYTKAAKADRESGDSSERHLYDVEWWHLRQSGARGFGGEQWGLALDIRTKLREYYASMLQYEQISAMNRPKVSKIKALSEWIESAHLGGGCGFIGRDLGGFTQESVFDLKNAADLVSPGNNLGEDDFLTRFLSGPMLRLFHKIWYLRKSPVPIDPDRPSGPDNRSSLYHYSDQHVQAGINIIGTAVSSLTPMISVVALYFMNSMKTRLGFVCLFTLIFSFTLALATQARRIEIFAATAAFASVQVVFVGSVGTPSGA